MMNLDDLQKRLTSLQGERQQLYDQLAKINMNISAYNGAIQEVEYWIGLVGAEVPAPIDSIGQIVDFS